MNASDENEYINLDEEPKIIKQVITDQAIYDMVMYLPLDKLELNKGDIVTVSLIIERAREKAEEGVKVDQGILEALEAVDKDSLCLDATISNMSFKSNDDSVNDPKIFSAAVFTLNGVSSVNFRGTPSKVWMDNSDGLDGVAGIPYTANGKTWNYLSYADIATLKYIESLDDEELRQFIASGHSKGSHEAFIVALVYPERVSACYGFDGQGVSPEMWEEIKQNYSDDPERLEAIREKINAINVENDPVHTFGWTKEDGYIAHNIYTIKGNEECTINPFANHFSQSFFTIDDKGKLQLNEAKENEGPMAEFFKQVSDRVMKLPPEERKPVTDTIMLFCQMGLGREYPAYFTNHDMTKTLANMDKGMIKACTIINDVIRNTDEGKGFINYLKSTSGAIAKFVLSFVGKHSTISNLILLYVASNPFSINVVLTGITVFITMFTKTLITFNKGSKRILLDEKIYNALNRFTEIAGRALCKAGCAMVYGVTQKIKAARHAILEFAVKTKNAAEKQIKQRVLILKYQMNQLAKGLNATATRVKELASGIADKAQKTFRVLSDSLSHGIESCKKSISNMQERIKTELIHTGERIKQTFEATKKNIMVFAARVNNNITNVVKRGKAVLEKGIERVKVGIKQAPQKVKAYAVQTVQTQTAVVSGAMEMCREATVAGVDKIKDSVYGGLSFLKDTILSMSGWLQEKTCTAIATARNTIHGDMIGRVGIDYAMIQRARIQIEEFTDDAMRLKRMIDDILSDLSTLRYKRVSTEQLVETKTQITRQRNYMNIHSDDLRAYEEACHKTEDGFIAALCCFR